MAAPSPLPSWFVPLTRHKYGLGPRPTNAPKIVRGGKYQWVLDEWVRFDKWYAWRKNGGPRPKGIWTRVPMWAWTIARALGRKDHSEPTVPIVKYPLKGSLTAGRPGLYFYCVSPETRVLSRDLRWVPAGELEVGDDLIAFDENHPGGGRERKFKESRVASTGGAHRPGFALYLADGTMLRCSEEHPWLVRKGHGGPTSEGWRRTDWIAERLRGGHRHFIGRYFDPWKERTDRDAGYLAGLYDGEGSLAYAAVGPDGAFDQMQLVLTQRPGRVLDEAKRILDRYKVPYGEYGSEVVRAHVSGRWQNKASVLGSIRPSRLLDKFVGSPLPTFAMRKIEWVEIVEAKPIARLEIVPMGTSTRTYFAEGFPAHNTYVNKQMSDQRLIELCRQFDAWVALLVHELDRAPDPSYDTEAQRHRLQSEGITVVASGWVEAGYDLDKQAQAAAHFSQGYDEYMANAEYSWSWQTPGFAASKEFAPKLRQQLGPAMPLSLSIMFREVIDLKPWLEAGLSTVRPQIYTNEWPHQNAVDAVHGLMQPQAELPHGIPPKMVEPTYGSYADKQVPMSSYSAQQAGARTLGVEAASVWTGESATEPDIATLAFFSR